MQVGMGLALMNPVTRPDQEVYEEALTLADRAEGLGFESLWAVEHHFTGHSPIPNPLQLLAYVAGRTETIGLGTAVVVLPWHHPIRVAEEIAVLDLLSRGRTMIGFGRGSSPIEYGHFAIPRDEGHERLAEGIECVQGMLSNEVFSFSGKFWNFKNLTIRPRPTHQPEHRLHGAAHTERSAALVGEAGLNLLFSPETDEAFTDTLVNSYQDAARANSHEAGSLTVHLYVSVAPTHKEAADRARRYMRPMVESLARHYEAVPGQINRPDRPVGDAEQVGQATDRFIAKHIVGTPQECFDRVDSFRRRYGLERFIAELSYGAMPLDEAGENMRLFAEDVMPRF